MSDIELFYEKTSVLVRGKKQDEIKKVLDRFAADYQERCLLVYEENPFILVTDYGLPFEATRAKRGLCDLHESLILIPTFRMHLKAMYALIFDLLRTNEGKGNSFESLRDLYLKVRHFCPYMTKERLRCYLYHFEESFYYDPVRDIVGFLFRRNQEIFIYSKIKDMVPRDFSEEASLYPDYELLDKEQNDAVRTVLSGGLTILTGGPGTGKTSTVRGLLSFYKKTHPDALISLLAPTGKAARRLTESISGYGAASTISSLTFSMKMHGVQKNSVYYDLMVIDESSMITTKDFYELLYHINIRQLILVGDIDQLPSVGCGNILSDILSMGAKTAYLKTNHRNQGNIFENADKIKKKQTDLIFGDDFSFIDTLDRDLIDRAVRLRGTDEDTMILTPYKKQAVEINRRIHEQYFRVEDYQPGDRVMFLKNDKPRGWMNGDMGTVKRFEEGNVIIVELMDADKTEVVVREKDLSEMTYGYAMTVHKSQGSEYKNCIILLPKNTASFFSRKLLYTAVTRARESVILLGSEKALTKIITSETEDRRDTFLGSLIREEKEAAVRAAA